MDYIKFGIYLPTNCEVKPGHVVKSPSSMTLHHVSITGEKADQCRYLIMPLLVVH